MTASLHYFAEYLDVPLKEMSVQKLKLILKMIVSVDVMKFPLILTVVLSQPKNLRIAI